MAIIAEGDPKAPFSIATTPRCRGVATPFPVLIHFTLDPYLIMLSEGGIKYYFLVFVITRPGIELRSPGPIRPIIGMIKTIWESAMKWLSLLLNRIFFLKTYDCVWISSIQFQHWITHTKFICRKKNKPNQTKPNLKSK